MTALNTGAISTSGNRVFLWNMTRRNDGVISMKENMAKSRELEINALFVSYCTTPLEPIPHPQTGQLANNSYTLQGSTGLVMLKY
jgi:hypothetical protein